MDGSFMQKKTYISKVLWYQGIGFFIIIAFSWIDEILNLSTNAITAETVFNWRECVVETLVVIAVALPVMLLTRRLLVRLYYLEGFLRVCAWCKKLENNNEWIPIETFFKETFKTESSHGICPECFEQTQQKLKKPVPK